ncbi:hypothetical protein EMN47_18655 [Prolixibacteraceae bacterium JC049]|nr:hypothetical protein [Prolixibacteraceae bacterium JC049]
MDKKQNKINSFWKALIGGHLLRDPRITKHYKYVLFVVGLIVLLIGNRYQNERIIREIDALKDSIKDLRSESISVAAELTNLSRPSEVARKVKEFKLNLIESDAPPKVIVVKKENE